MKRKRGYLVLMIVLVLLGIILFFYQIEASPKMQSAKAFQTSSIYREDSRITVLGRVDEIDPNSIAAVGEIDQQQTKIDTAYYIGPVSNNLGWYAQIVQNDRPNCDGFAVAVGYHGNPSKDLYFGMMSPIQDPRFIPDNYLRIASINMDIMQFYDPDVAWWILVDNTHEPYLGKLFAIVLVSEEDPSDESYWFSAAGTDNPYTRQKCEAWCFAEEIWCSYIEDDLCFKTYTPSNGGNGGAPTISISYTSWIVTQVAGIFSFIGAGAAGTKYLGLF